MAYATNTVQKGEDGQGEKEKKEKSLCVFGWFEWVDVLRVVK